MSYLNPTRLNFAGRFQADVSTVNNDVRHYQDADFRASFQELQTAGSLNGWWNPTGSGAFRFVGCQVTGVGNQTGETTTGPADDIVIGASVAGAADRSAAKLVDIDPQWQLASAPWGLGVRLIAGGVELLSGEYTSHAFRDLWFSRLVGASQDGAASSTFQSVLTDVVFSDAGLEQSPALRELDNATFGDHLSMRLTTFGYDGGATSPSFTLGTMVGAIGPYLEGEPESFVLGRRFAPAAGFSSYGAGITFFSGLLDDASRTLMLDLSNALQITDGQGTLYDIGTLSVGVLADESIAENTPATAENFLPLGTVDYRRPGWLAETSGVVALSVDVEQYEAARSRPLALVYDMPFNPGASGEGEGLGVVAIRETTGGLFVGAEPIVVRLDAGDTAEVNMWATRYGASVEGHEIRLRQLGRVPDQGGAGRPDPHVDPIPIPDMGFPESALSFPAAVPVDGATSVTLMSSDPGNPRGYVDGQVYLVDYRLPGQGNNSKQPFDFVVVHVRDAYTVPTQPDWDNDVLPILTQFSNLYPIMSRGFIDLTDKDVVIGNRVLLTIAFARPITDPNHMPVTRDLSGPKRQTLLNFLAAADLSADGAPGPVPGHRPAAPMPATADRSVASSSDSKTRFAETFLTRGRRSRSTSQGEPTT